MTKSLYAFLTLLLACSSSASAPSKKAIDILPQYAPGEQSMLALRMEGGTCTGVKIGEHTMLTAQHCFDEGGTLARVNDKECSGGILYKDGGDTVQVRTSCRLPGIAAKVGKVPPVGTEIYIWGNPLDMRNLLRIGHVAGTFTGEECQPCDVFDINIWNGDSGGGYFDSKGKVIAIVYGTRGPVKRNWNMAISMPIKFTKKQLEDNE